MQPRLSLFSAAIMSLLCGCGERGSRGIFPESAHFLIEAGADVHARTLRGGTILHEAASTGSAEMVQFCLDQGVDRSVVASDGGTALEVARAFQNEAAIQLLSQFD